ncbi:MAG: hypothetical protein K0Q59_371 [Paenibacillus sp.]|jgi:multiple sugar transport system substrate-binding protein|nr:hypothetical protein [Paenibacillus sp.]
MFSRKKSSLAAALLTLMLTATACGGGGGDKPEGAAGTGNGVKETAKPEPVDLNFLFASDIADFDKKYADHVRAKYPHINLKLVKMAPAEAIASNTPIDILFNSITVLGQYVDVKLTRDIADLAAAHKVDLSRFHPELLDTLKLVDNGKLIGLPQKSINLVMFYNKDLFDKFGVPYPKDGVTWEETAELARRMTRLEDGVQYRGFVGGLAQMLGQNQYGLSLVDAKTNTTAYDKEQRWSSMFNTFKSLYAMSGYGATEDLLKDASQRDLFRKEKTAAMWVTDHSNFPPESDKLNWDVVSAPVFADKRTEGPAGVFTAYLVSANSKHPDAAMLAIDALTSPETQEWNARELLAVPTLKDRKISESFAKGNPAFQGKNMKPFIPAKFAPAIAFNTHYTIARTPLVNNLNAFIVGKKDVNTAMRDATEEANKAIQAKVSSGK